MAVIKVKYIEPEGYIPKNLRKKYGLGEFAETNTDTKKTPEKTPEKKADTKKK